MRALPPPSTFWRRWRGGTPPTQIDGRGFDRCSTTYAGTRAAAADLVNNVLLASAGMTAFQKLTPGTLTLGPAIAAALAQQAGGCELPARRQPRRHLVRPVPCDAISRSGRGHHRRARAAHRQHGGVRRRGERPRAARPGSASASPAQADRCARPRAQGRQRCRVSRPRPLRRPHLRSDRPRRARPIGRFERRATAPCYR